jgi:antibiotic biosynthesis monooxygenase (ABM) superfamily enzyme
MELKLMLRRLLEAANQYVNHWPEVDQSGYASVVVEYVVPREQRWAFRFWHGRLVRTAERAEGFVRADRYRPLNCQNGALKWHSVIHFDQPEHLSNWLSSPQREAVLQNGREIFKTYKFKSFETGLEGWFSHRAGAELDSLGPPAWKQILSVVLGLYPVIMVQDFLFSSLEIFEDWPPARAMLVNNLITTCILTLVVMPFIVRLLDFWLQPAHSRASIRSEIVGAVFAILAMGLMVFMFDELA